MLFRKIVGAALCRDSIDTGNRGIKPLLQFDSIKHDRFLIIRTHTPIASIRVKNLLNEIFYNFSLTTYIITSSSWRVKNALL